MKSLGAILLTIGAISFIAWLAFVKVNGLGDTMTVAAAIVPVVFSGIGALIMADRIVMGVVLLIIGVVSFVAWLAQANTNTLSDITTNGVAIVPVAFIGVGAFFTADGIAAANKNPPYGKEPA